MDRFSQPPALPDSVFRLVYTSTAAAPMFEEELTELLQKARRHNGLLGVTGALVYREDTFLQVLEGPEEAVRALYYGSIQNDTRHKECLVLWEGAAQVREFDDWSMGFYRLAAGELPGHRSLDDLLL
ncbi:MAG: BLUF domain-containing protein [Acidobacteria bacterium]|nr:BLUF domain-containing protein [Acidobacteriota bacterium]